MSKNYTKIEPNLKIDGEFRKVSFKTSSNTVECDDGETTEIKFRKALFIESFDANTGELRTFSYNGGGA